MQNIHLRVLMIINIITIYTHMYDIQLVVRDHEVNTCTQLTVYKNEFLRKCLSVSAFIIESIIYCIEFYCQCDIVKCYQSMFLVW